MKTMIITIERGFHTFISGINKFYHNLSYSHFYPRYNYKNQQDTVIGCNRRMLIVRGKFEIIGLIIII